MQDRLATHSSFGLSAIPTSAPTTGMGVTDLGEEVFPREQRTPEALSALQKSNAEKWWPIIKEFGLKAE